MVVDLMYVKCLLYGGGFAKNVVLFEVDKRYYTFMTDLWMQEVVDHKISDIFWTSRIYDPIALPCMVTVENKSILGKIPTDGLKDTTITAS